MLLSQRHPILYALSVAFHRLERYFRWLIRFSKYARTQQTEPLPMKVFAHKSVLLRKLGDADMELQRNKVTNLKLAVRGLNGIIIRPGETLSLWQRIGKPTSRKGYVEGMLLSNGEVKRGIGGGLCQIANLVYWIALHTPLAVTERHHHSFDAFPDSGRVLPFGTGATLFYNYLDIEITNTTPDTFQLLIWVDDEFLRGEIRADRQIPVRYHIREEDHRYLRDAATGIHYRSNKIFREVRETDTGRVLSDEHLMANFSRMKYEPPAGIEVHELASVNEHHRTTI